MIRIMIYSLVSFVTVGYAGAFPTDSDDILRLLGAWVMFVCVALALQSVGILFDILTGHIAIEIVDEYDEDDQEDSEE